MPEVKPLVIDAVTGAIREIIASDTLPSSSIPSSGGGGGIANAVEIELDFGTHITQNYEWTIVDASVSIGKKIMVWQSPNQATGQKSNDWELDKCQFTAVAGIGEFIIKANGDEMIGFRKIYYTVFN